ncbi:hypothetical protein INT45_013527, partial [Circinella minor]
GNPFDRDTFQGPRISENQFNSVMNYIDIDKNECATCYLGGNKVGDMGYFIESTIFTDLHIVYDNRCHTGYAYIVKEEIFGPVVAISKFNDADNVIAQANDITYGLAAAVHTSNITHAITISNALEAGSVLIINMHL